MARSNAQHSSLPKRQAVPSKKGRTTHQKGATSAAAKSPTVRNPIEIEKIEEIRRQEGIDDVELRVEIRALKIGDFVKLTFLIGSAGFETLSVRITSIRGSAFRGKLADKPVSPALSELGVGSPVLFTADHIHSIAQR
jgi:hypothetical protein